jgi:uncharacterized Rmd1/YagE family protein
MEPVVFGNKDTIDSRALFIGERIDLRALETARRLAISPLIITSGECGCAAIFRYGVVVLFGLKPLEEVACLSQIQPLLSEAFETQEAEEVKIRVDSTIQEGVDQNGMILLHEFSVERLQIVADILAKSVVLGRYESRVAEVFDRIEPLAASLQQRGQELGKGKELMRHIGDTLLIQHKMVGRVEVSEKPEVLWDRPELGRLYAYLEDEYELRERHLALERKLDLIAKTVETQLDLLHNNRALRVEWYIVLLIVIEILLTLYQMFVKG